MDKIIVYRIIRITNGKVLYIGCAYESKLMEDIREFFHFQKLQPEEVNIVTKNYDTLDKAVMIQEELIILEKPVFNKVPKSGWEKYDYADDTNSYYIYNRDNKIAAIVFKFKDAEVTVDFEGNYEQLDDWCKFMYRHFENMFDENMAEYKVPIVLYPYPKNIHISRPKHYVSAMKICSWNTSDRYMLIYKDGIVALKAILYYSNFGGMLGSDGFINKIVKGHNLGAEFEDAIMKICK